MPAIENTTGIRRGRLETLLKILAVDDVVDAGSGRLGRDGHGRGTSTAEVGGAAQVREREADLMRRFAAGEGCLMRFLQEALDDPEPEPCGRCSVCTGELPGPGARPGAETRRGGARVLPRSGRGHRAAQALACRGAGRKGRIAGCARAGRWPSPTIPAWGERAAALSQRDGAGAAGGARRDGRGARRWRRSWERPVAVVPMPSRAAPAAGRLGGRASGAVGPAAAGRRAGGDRAAAGRRGGVGGAGAALLDRARRCGPASRCDGPVLLVDARFRSGWSVTVAAALLREAGAAAVLPLVLHRLP